MEKGFFAKHGVEVTLLPMTGYVDSLNLYKEGKADAAFMVFVDTIMFESEGIPTRAIYITDYSDTSGDMIVGLPTLNSLSELKGKKVSFEGFNTFSLLLVLKLLEQAGIHEGEFLSVIKDHTEVLEALETGQIQAAHTYGVTASQSLAKGYKILGKAGSIPHLMMGGLVANAKVVATRREELQKVVKALVEATEWLKHSPDEGFEIVAKYANNPKSEIETTFNGLHIFTLQENQEIFKKGSNLFKGGQEIIDFFYQKGVLIKIPDLNQIIDAQFVNAVGTKP
jgi:NitT/TauT family transport system substrate-binding protein